MVRPIINFTLAIIITCLQIHFHYIPNKRLERKIMEPLMACVWAWLIIANVFALWYK